MTPVAGQLTSFQNICFQEIKGGDLARKNISSVLLGTLGAVPSAPPPLRPMPPVGCGALLQCEVTPTRGRGCTSVTWGWHLPVRSGHQQDFMCIKQLAFH